MDTVQVLRQFKHSVVTLNSFQGLNSRKDADHEVAIRPLRQWKLLIK
jgi:hypothetical protein